jgi:hypothetical protein
MTEKPLGSVENAGHILLARYFDRVFRSIVNQFCALTYD